MLLDKCNAEAIVNKQDELMPYTQVIALKEDYTVTTDGHILIKVPYPDNVKVEDYPIFPGDEEGSDKIEYGFTVPINPIRKVEKTLPARKDVLPILKTVHVYKIVPNEDDKGADTDMVFIDTIDNRMATFNSTSYPNIDRVIPDKSDAVFTIALNIDILYNLLKALRKGRDYCKDSSRVQFKFIAPDRAVLFETTEGLSGVVMPVRDPNAGFDDKEE